MRRPRGLGLLCLALLLAACAPPAPGVCPPASAASNDAAYVIDHGWHTDLGVPASELSGPIAVLRRLFPGAASFTFGFGKRTFITAKTDNWREWILGPIPGPAAIQVTGLSVLPDAAFGRAATVRLALPAGGAAALSAFLWREFAHDAAGGPRVIGPGPDRGSLFFAASAIYTLARTCNAWTAGALHVAGTAVRAGGVMFASQTMARARAAAAAAARCKAAPAG